MSTPAATPTTAPPWVQRNPIGTHVLVGKGLVAGALTDAHRLGCETLQVFVGNPRGWALSPGRPAEDEAFRVVEIAGPGRLRLVHANDSMDARGAMNDSHERIGRGRIGTGAFPELFAHPALAGVPLILETPGSREPGGDVEVLHGLRERACTGRVTEP